MNITGNSQNNTLNGTSGDDTIDGLEGNDLLKGRSGNDILIGGLGDDILRGGTGDNLFLGGAGDDTLELSGRYESIEFGLGEDLVDLSGFSMGDGYVSLFAHSGAQGLFALIDGEEDFGAVRVDNGFDPEGLLFFEDLNNALQLDSSKPEGGMGLSGTAYDDIFNVDPGAQGWIQIRPGEGEDVIRIEGSGGSVRLDYSDQTDGIFANLKFGFVIDGGAGFGLDQIGGSGRVTELRGTDFDDEIYGSKYDDRFILGQGDDFVAGGRGDDLVRYDRSGVDAVVVDLGAKTATGTWGGQAFTHTFKSIEDVRGSRDGDDTLKGSKADNFISGGGGRDVIEGRAGDDFLLGGSGKDRFLFRDNSGHDVIGDFNTGSNSEKINLRKVSAITDFGDLVANHLTETDGNTIIDNGADMTITLQNVLIADLESGDFLF